MAKSTSEIRCAILGASGYTGAELMRLMAGHPSFRPVALTADRKAGQPYGSVYPHLAHLNPPDLTTIAEVDWDGIDLAFCALPHATSQEVVTALPRDLKIVDLSADFRLRDPAVYEEWYGRPHSAMELQAEAVYGLTEFYREEIGAARLVAGTGCNAATGLYAVLPLLQYGVIDPDEIIISLITGVSGAGRSAKENLLAAEVSEGAGPYALGGHRHVAEFEQEFSKMAGQPVTCTFVPHLLPQNRGILASVYVKGALHDVWGAVKARYHEEPFVQVLPIGEAPATRHVRGSNFCKIGVVKDRRPGRSIVFAALDNLVKGASGQAIQNANLMCGLEETAGLQQAPLFP